MAEMNSRRLGRRRFLTQGIALAGVAAGARSASAQSHMLTQETGDIGYGERSRFVNTRRPSGASEGREALLHRAASAQTPLRESLGIITPSALHFTTSHGWAVPDIDPSRHRLMIHGMVDRPLVFSMDELKRLPFVSRIHFIECLANIPTPRGRNVDQMHGRTACSEWTGVPLSLLLQEAGVRTGANWIVAEGIEGGKHTKSLPMPKAMADVMVAYGQNGEPLRPNQGFPLRLIVPGWEGLTQVKWLRRIKVVDQAYVTYQEQTRFSSPDPKTRGFQFELGPKSVIIFPSGEQHLPGRGHYVITGLAWSGGGAIRRVEISTDGGRTWKDARLQDPVLRMAHTRFDLGWQWNGEDAELQSRCTDELGQVQSTVAEFARFWGRSPKDLYEYSATRIGHFNYIQPWRVMRDGMVHNGLQA